MKNSILILCFIILSGFAIAQTDIADARTFSVGSSVTVSGIVTNGPELSTIRYFQDASAGIAVYSYDVTYFAPGDSITVTGVLDDYNNLLEIASVTFHTVHSSNNPMPVPAVITPAQMSEDYESELVQLENVVFDNAGSTFQANTSYTFSFNGESSTVYIRSGHPLVGAVIPGNPVTLIGICSQFYANYQLLLRGPDDIINGSAINIISPIAVSNISTSSFDLQWLTDSAATTEVFYGKTQALEMGLLQNPGSGTSHAISFTGLDPATIYYVLSFSVLNDDTAFSNVNAFCTQSLSSGEMKAYFTRSVDNSVSTGTDAIFLDDLVDDTLINYINRATESIDLTIYDFNPANISDIAGALNNAHANGVEVRAIFDTSWTTVNLGQLLSPGINSLPAPDLAEYGIMHNKFVVFDADATDPDKAIVWTGSTNFEDVNINTFANNVIIVHDQSLARAYRAEFNEMWGGDSIVPNLAQSKFGPFKKDNTPHEFIIGGNRVECYFSPSDGTNSKIGRTISSADDELFVETMLITRTDLGDSILSRVSNGVQTKVIIDDPSSSNSSVVNGLESALGSNFKIYGEDGMLHNKLMIVDPAGSDPLVLTGSHNWSSSAENRNDENTLIIHNAEMANIYLQEFMARFQNALPVPENPFIDWSNKLYPNPSQGQFIIDMNDGSGQIIEIVIFDVSGKEVYRNHTINPLDGKVLIEDFSAKAGVYFVKLMADQYSETRRLSIIH
ncbi:MAG: DUF5689 domain-containing protein [Bacteroidales bacterium]|nr:DUF5689 domain-containing protein [Bacteroidales bacterium]MCF8457468.1 DUF5689 domain-containing protein [Bacteroidales bacterium]